MPFKKVGSNDYTSPSGRHFNQAQVRLYYANGGKFPGQKMKNGGPVMAAHGADEVRYANPKGYRGVPVSMAAGGPVTGRTRDFAKAGPQDTAANLGRARNFETPDGKVDEFSSGRMPAKFSAPAKQEYGAKGAPAKRLGDKSERAVKPRT